MKKFLTLLAFGASQIFWVVPAADAHTIGGAYASLVSCKWGKYGYEFGYIGTYKVNGQIISEFFGSNYCAY